MDDNDNEREQFAFVLYSIFVSGVRDLYDQIFNAMMCVYEERIIRCEVVKKKKSNLDAILTIKRSGLFLNIQDPSRKFFLELSGSLLNDQDSFSAFSGTVLNI